MKNGKSRPTERTGLGRYIVAAPEICHGKPTFKGTRIMVWQVLDDVTDGRSWDFICNTRFATQAKRMGTVIRAHHNGVHFSQRNRSLLQRAEW